MTANANPVSPTPSFIALILIAVVFLTAGVFGLLMPDIVPPLASPKIAWSLIAVAIIMDGAAVVNLYMDQKGRPGGRVRVEHTG